MALEDRLNQVAADVFSDDDRISHTHKMVERTFGMDASELGAVEMRDGKALLVVQYQGRDRTLEWQRASNGSILWYLDGEKKLILPGPDRALAVLRDNL